MKFTDVVRPLFDRKENGEPVFEGTCFFCEIGNQRYVVTAKHVIDACQNPFFLEPQTGSSFGRFDHDGVNLEIVASDTKTDLALLRPVDFTIPAALSLKTDFKFVDRMVGTVEYSRSTIVEPGKGKVPNHTFSAKGSTRIGNVVRFFSDERYPDSSLELSYPALKGASGAPVMNMQMQDPDYFKVVGIVVANASYELLPVQKYEYVDKDGSYEQTHYYLPAGIAIHAKHLVELANTPNVN